MFWKCITETVTRTIADTTTCYCSMLIVTMKSTVEGVYDKDPNTEEPDEAKVSRPVREWRRGG
jgi:uridylate kinase